MDYYEYILNPIKLNVIRKLNWRNLWIKKVDYIKEIHLEIKGKYACIDESINYYITMAEIAICYLNNYDNFYDYSYIQHKIILDETFFNKSYITEDIKERDFAEYLKYIYFNHNYDMNFLGELLARGNGIFNYDLVIARLLFPNYYFFYLEKYLLEDDDRLFSIIDCSFDYENYVNSIVNIINKFKSKKIILPF